VTYAPQRITETKCGWVFFPPSEVFISDNFLNDYQGVRMLKLEGWEMYLGADGGLFSDRKEPYPYPGAPCPIIIGNVAIFKRVLIARLKNPFAWIGFKREVTDIAYTALKKYYFKPQYYSHAVREIYRVLETIRPDELNHAACMVLEWDNAYRFRIQAFLGNLNLSARNIRKEILENIRYSFGDDYNKRVKKHWLAAERAFKILWLVPKFRRFIKDFIKEADFTKICPDEADIYYQSH